MKVILAFFLCTILSKVLLAQVTEKYTPQQGNVRIGAGDKDVLKYNDKGYTLFSPEKGISNNSVIIVLDDDRYDPVRTPETQIHQYALPKGFHILYISTGLPVDLYFSMESIIYVEDVISDVFRKSGLKEPNVFFLAVNLAGHRALKMADRYHRLHGAPPFRLKGVVLCDGVLDWVRMWYECKKAVRDNFAESSLFEAKMLIYLLEQNLGGTPTDKLPYYVEFSPYCYLNESKHQFSYLTDVAVRAYTEPAPYYWMEAKRKGTFDTNYPDHVGLINQLKLEGNTRAELHVFTQDKNNMDRRNPDYTWGLVDKKELVEWMLKQIK